MSKKRIIEEQATTEIFNDDWLVKDSVTQGTTKIQPSVFKAWINDGMATEEDIETIVGNIADTYSTSESYAEGDLCIHEYALFKCIGATTGTWDSTKWESTTIAEIISTIDLSAEAISYDNASSGLEAENVQDAIDETITKLSAVGSASGAIATFTDGSALPMPKLEVSIEPQQDLHGYDAPWVGGAGKNKLPMTVDGIKTANTSGTWSGNVYSINNGTFTILTDSNENVIGIKVNGTFSTSTVLNMDSKVLSGNYVLNGCPSGGDSNTYRLDLRRTNGGDVYTDNGSGVEVSGINESVYGVIRIQSGYSASNITFSPMLRLSTETDATFEPYENECPIIGWDEVDVTVADDVENPTVSNVYTIDLDGTRYGGTLDVVSGVLTLTHGFADLGDLAWTYSSSSGRSLFTSNDITHYKHTGSNDIPVNAICECFAIVPMSSTFVNGQMGMDGDTARNRTIICDNRYSDATAFKTAMNGAQLVYELATPQTIQLTPTEVKSLLGQNNVWADTGNILEAKYVRDLTSTINYILEQLNS